MLSQNDLLSDSHELDLVGLLLDHMPVGVALFGCDLRLRHCNPTWAAFVAGYASAVKPAAGVHLLELVPGQETTLLPLLERALAGEVVRQEAARTLRNDNLAFWDVVFSPVMLDGDVAGLITTVTDATERVHAMLELQETAQALSEEQERFALAVNGTNDGIWDWDLETNESYFSPRWKDMIGYADDELPNTFETWRSRIHPDDLDRVMAELKAYLEGRATIYSIEHRLLHKDGSYRWILARGASLRRSDGRPYRMAGSHTDVTRRKAAEEALQTALAALQESQSALERRVEERTREFATLLQVSSDIVSRLDLDQLLGVILDQLRVVVDYSGASVLALDDADLRVIAYRGPIPPADALAIRFQLEDAGPNQQVIDLQQPVIIDDVRGETELARAFQKSAGAAMDTTFSYIRSWLGVPLVARGHVIGMLSLDHSMPGIYTQTHARLALAFANQVAVAIENARLYETEQDRLAEAERRREVAESLRDILAVLNSRRPLADILEYIVGQAGRLLGTDTGAIYGLQADKDVLTVQAARGLPADYAASVAIPLGQGAVGLAALERRPVAVPDIESALAQALATDPAHTDHLRWLVSSFRTLLAVPLTVGDELYGGIVLYFPQPKQLSEEDIDLAVTFADQAALAIENASLREQAAQAAVAAERSRLARDLHDAVTQTLFSASLIAEVLPRLWERSPAEGQRRVGELRELTRGALAEMRTLLLELRPSALTEASLGDLLRQLGEATTGRARIPVTVKIETEPDLEPDVQFALYRIAQEALNNVAKHSGAHSAVVIVRPRIQAAVGGAGEQQIELSVRDDGCGFDTEGISPDNLGLSIMRERSEAIGAELRIESMPGQGTCVTAIWPALIKTP